MASRFNSSVDWPASSTASSAEDSSLRGSHAYGSYVLAEPDGSGNLHDKDIPTVWENNYYRGGSDDGVVDSTSLGRVGIACGWEWARNRTARRLRAGGVQLLTGGMCWPSFPGNWRGPLGRMMEREGESSVSWPASCLARWLG